MKSTWRRLPYSVHELFEKSLQTLLGPDELRGDRVERHVQRLRDLGEDAEMGRIYLPREDLEKFGYSFDDLRAHRCDDRFRSLMAFETSRAKTYYQKAEHLFDYLEPAGKPILRAMLRIYGGLLKEIERCDYNVFERPVSLPTWKKILIAADTMVRRRWRVSNMK